MSVGSYDGKIRLISMKSWQVRASVIQGMFQSVILVAKKITIILIDSGLLAQVVLSSGISSRLISVCTDCQLTAPHDNHVLLL
jgi:hypothetical protein